MVVAKVLATSNVAPAVGAKLTKVYTLVPLRTPSRLDEVVDRLADRCATLRVRFADRAGGAAPGRRGGREHEHPLRRRMVVAVKRYSREDQRIMATWAADCSSLLL